VPEKQRESITKNIDQTKFGALYVDACAQRMKGNLQEALKLFEECKNIDPNNNPVKYELGTIYKLLGLNQQAIINAKICAAADPKNEWYQLLLIDCYHSFQQYDQSLKIRETLVNNFPDKTEFKEDLAIEYSITGQYDKAYKIYQTLENIYGVNEQLTLNKVKLLKEQKRNNEAEVELIKLKNADKNEIRYLNHLAEYYMELGALEKAKQVYDQMRALEPDNPRVNLALHDYYSAKGKNAEAFDYLKKAFQNPDLDAATKANIVSSFYKSALEQNVKATRDEGFELAKIFIEVQPTSAESNYLYADFLILEKNLIQASKYYYTSTTLDRRNYSVWAKLMVVDYELGAYDSLEHHSFSTLETFPNQPAAYLYNGIANIQLKNYKKAVTSLNDGIEFVVNNKTLLLDFYKSLGDAAFYLKDYAQSDRVFEKALKLDADNTYVLNNYAYFLSLRNEQLDKAEKLSRRTIELRPNDKNYMDTYGWILYQQKNYTKAAEWLFNASNFVPKNPNILEHYGDALYRLNKPMEALQQWIAAKQAGGNSESLLKKINDKKLND